MKNSIWNQQKSNELSFLVDATSVASDPDWPYLLSFDGVDGISVEQNVLLVERPGQGSKAILRADSSLHVSIAPLNQFKQFATDIAARPGVPVATETIHHALAYSFLADRLGFDAVVTPARSAFDDNDRGLLDVGRLVTVGEALAMIGAYVRQRETVSLGGKPLFVQERTEVYPLTARVIINRAQEWWSSCIAIASSPGADLVSQAQAVFGRAGQALRGRDGVHEALRLRRGRGAVLDALYHFDVVLASGVASLDALARVANDVFGISSPPRRVGWQRDWRKDLARVAPAVAAVVDPKTRLGAALRVLTVLRNSLHSIPLDEYLQVIVLPGPDIVEHRIKLPRDLADELRDPAVTLGAIDAVGIHLDDVATSFVNIPQLTEHLLSWTYEMIGELFDAMLQCPQFAPGPQVTFAPVEEQEHEYCAKLARVGEYPRRILSEGLPASPSVRRTVLASVYAHLPRQ